MSVMLGMKDAAKSYQCPAMLSWEFFGAAGFAMA
jgi:hypothetical protein